MMSLMAPAMAPRPMPETRSPPTVALVAASFKPPSRFVNDSHSLFEDEVLLLEDRRASPERLREVLAWTAAPYQVQSATGRSCRARLDGGTRRGHDARFNGETPRSRP
jgi:hypothetical protein